MCQLEDLKDAREEMYFIDIFFRLSCKLMNVINNGVLTGERSPFLLNLFRRSGYKRLRRNHLIKSLARILAKVGRCHMISYRLDPAIADLGSVAQAVIRIFGNTFCSVQSRLRQNYIFFGGIRAKKIQI